MHGLVCHGILPLTSMRREKITLKHTHGTTTETGSSTEDQQFSTEKREIIQTVTGSAFIPLSEMFGYATDLRSKTQGRGTYSMEPSHYEEVPKSVLEQIVASRGKKSE